MKKFLIAAMAVLLTLSLASCSLYPSGEYTETTDTADANLFSSDLSLEALADILRETGDDIDFFDIPEEYFYMIPNPALPMLCYPIDESHTFYITQMSEDAYTIILSTETENGKADYACAEDIIAYIESIS